MMRSITVQVFAVLSVLFGHVFCTELPGYNTTFTKDYSCALLDTEQDCLNIPPFYTTDDDIFSQLFNLNYTCMWNGTQCQRLICSNIATESECTQYSTDQFNFICDWTDDLLPLQIYDSNSTDSSYSSYSGNYSVTDGTPMCFNDCPTKYQVVIAVDTSVSAIDPNQGGDVDNRVNALNTVSNIFTHVWYLSQLQNSNDEEHGMSLHEDVKFSLITYNSDVTVHFDLNNNLTSLDEYTTLVNDIFTNQIEYLDDTATVLAINEAYNVFDTFNADTNNGITYNASDMNDMNDMSNVESLKSNDAWHRIFIAITLGQGNIPATASSPCGANDIYNFNQKFSNLGGFTTSVTDSSVGTSSGTISFHTFMVGSYNDEESFSCLNEAPLFANIEYMPSFDDINDQLSTILFDHTKICSNNNNYLYNDIDSDEESDSKKNKNNGFPLWLIIVLAAAGCVLLTIMAVMAAAFVSKKKEQAKQDEKGNGQQSVDDESKTMISA